MLMFRLVKMYSFLLDPLVPRNNNKNSKMKHRILPLGEVAERAWQIGY